MPNTDKQPVYQQEDLSSGNQGCAHVSSSVIVPGTVESGCTNTAKLLRTKGYAKAMVLSFHSTTATGQGSWTDYF